MGLVGFPGGSDGKESACDAGDPGLIPSQGRCPREGNGREDSIFLPGEFHGQRSLVGYSPWGCKQSDISYLANRRLVLSVWHEAHLFLALRNVNKWPVVNA